MAQKKSAHDPLEGGSSLWHRWMDNPGMRYKMALWQNGDTLSCGDESRDVRSVEAMCTSLPGHFCLCHDILCTSEFPFCEELIGDGHVTPYLSRTGGITALQMRVGRYSYGFLVPASSWGWLQEPDKRLLERLTEVFETTGYQSSTASSLSEKVLRATLPDRSYIARAHPILCAHVLDNNEGGRIDKAVVGEWYEEVHEYDINKAYLAYSLLTPSPFCSPIRHCYPTVDEALEGYPTGFWEVSMTARRQAIAPIHLEGRNPKEGESFTKWLWTGEILDCLEAGYTLSEIKQGYGVRALSDWLLPWADKLWDYYQEASDPFVKSIYKQMMVGLPGRFLRSPERYRLVPLRDCERGDIPLKLHWLSGSDAILSDWCIRPEHDSRSASLPLVGSFIVCEARRGLYHAMQKEYQNGNSVIRSYVDCFAIHRKSPVSLVIGTGRGEWKEKRYSRVFAEENRFIGEDEYGQLQARLPGYGRLRREAEVLRYRDERGEIAV